ncbi:TetR/AcrR family transcriptional regulator [Phenylobacterium sp. SCN 70-31]|uniref:TetR/AcrR family transcriptional regulator n=1 Tax=Phenylobacterium sp. SCN 70-31 TaxID=1660129 RepID=UPI00086AF9E9|nr:TetR/AcrR family transcriptional regulator [Phenylobacterium sp. SCN 70-31]ODT87172.1 MAG: TetR family transcriptional regulator [Phenylobacterium sp. SCN 70-31]
MGTVAPATRKTTRKAKGDGHLRRAEILAAAERIFVAEGYEGATIRKIADEVGVSSTALYMHFADKACILHEIVEGTLNELLRSNTEIAAKPLDPVVRTRMMLDAYMRWGFEHPNAYHLVYCATPPASTDPSPDRTSDLARECYEAFSGVVKEVAAAGRLRIGDADTAAQAIWTACHGLVALVIGRPTFEWADREELMGVTLDGMLHGLVID